MTSGFSGNNDDDESISGVDDDDDNDDDKHLLIHIGKLNKYIVINPGDRARQLIVRDLRNPNVAQVFIILLLSS